MRQVFVMRSKTGSRARATTTGFLSTATVPAVIQIAAIGAVGLKTALFTIALAAWLILGADNSGTAHASEGEVTPVQSGEDAPTTISEARARARLLHETVHGTLQVMHRDFFHEDDGSLIPSRSLEDVFAELFRNYQVEVRWLAVSAEAMSIDHKPKSEFEKQAVRALAAGKQEFEITQQGLYRHAGLIRLSSQCLKCHAPRRSSTDDRAAGLVISIPLKKPLPRDSESPPRKTNPLQRTIPLQKSVPLPTPVPLQKP
jgi:hypothetical protein